MKIRRFTALIEYRLPVIYEYFGSKGEIQLELLRIGWVTHSNRNPSSLLGGR